MTSTENRTRFPHAKFFVMHSILLYSSLRLSFKNHPSIGLDFSDPRKLPEGWVKPGAASSCSSAVMCSSYLILMLPSWRNLAAGLRADTQKQVMSYSFLSLVSSHLVPGVSKSFYPLPVPTRLLKGLQTPQIWRAYWNVHGFYLRALWITVSISSSIFPVDIKDKKQGKQSESSSSDHHHLRNIYHVPAAMPRVYIWCHFICTSLRNIIPILQMKKLRLWEVKLFAQGHTQVISDRVNTGSQVWLTPFIITVLR